MFKSLTIFLVLIVSPKAFGQANVAENAIRITIEQAAGRYLQHTVDGFLGPRIGKPAYTSSLEISVKRELIKTLAGRVSSADEDSLVATVLVKPSLDGILTNLKSAQYAEIVKYLEKVHVNLTFSQRIPEERWQSLVAGLSRKVVTGLVPDEKINAVAGDLPLSNSEREDLAMQAARGENLQALERLRSNNKKEQIRLSEKLRNERFEAEARRLEEQIADKDREISGLSEQISSERIDQRMARDMPLLLKYLAIGGAIGLAFIVALFLLSLGILAAALTFGKRFLAASKETSTALKSAFGGQSVEAIHRLTLAENIQDVVFNFRKALEQPLQDDDEQEQELGDVEPDLLKELEKTIEELKILVKSDYETTAAQVTALCEGREYDKVFYMLDLLGNEISRILFEKLHPKQQRELKRYFFNRGASTNPPPKLLYLIAVEFRAMLTSSNILIRGDGERRLSQVLLCHSDQEIANALKVVDDDKSVAILASLPPSRVVTIMRNVDVATSVEWRKKIVKAVKGFNPLSSDDIVEIQEIINKPSKVAFDEATAYLKDLMKELGETEAEDVLEGADDDPKLKAAISGLRASMDDLWAQDIEVIFRISGALELRPMAALMLEAPDEIRSGLLDYMVGRRKDLLKDELINLETNEKVRKDSIRSNARARRQILDKLADMADDGQVLLPYTRPEMAHLPLSA